MVLFMKIIKSKKAVVFWSFLVWERKRNDMHNAWKMKLKRGLRWWRSQARLRALIEQNVKNTETHCQKWHLTCIIESVSLRNQKGRTWLAEFVSTPIYLSGRNMAKLLCCVAGEQCNTSKIIEYLKGIINVNFLIL